MRNTIIFDTWATKQDLKELELRIKESELRLTLRMGGMLGASIAILATLMELL